MFSYQSYCSGLIVAISTFTGGARQGPPSGGDYFIGFVIILIAIGWIVAAVADFFMLTKVRQIACLLQCSK